MSLNIPLRNRAGQVVATALVDDEDYERVMAQGRWALQDIGRWRAQHSLNYKRIHIGTFDTAEEAAQAAASWRAKNMPYSEEATA